MQTEPTYRIKNWAEYNKALIQRGNISIWIDDKSVKNWFSSYHTCQAGRPATYSDEAILMMLILREVYKCSLRSLQGFVQSLFKAMDLDLPVPSYSQISRRAKSLHKRVSGLTNGKQARHIIFDSTGLKVHGEGEWKVKIHGKSKRRTWRKFPIAIDAQTQDILCCELTGNNKRDAAYKGIKEEGWQKQRDDAIAAIHGFGGDDIGRRFWKICSGYHERSLAETAMFRVKRMFGGGLKARSIGSQKTESICKCIIINKMNELGMPRFEWLIEST